MKLQLLAFCLALILNLTCSDPSGQTGQVRNEIKNDKMPKNKPAGSYSDTIRINLPSAVFYSPDPLQLEKIKAVTEPMIFESVMHDCFYQMRNSRYSVQKNWPKIKIVEIRNARYILFQPAGGGNECVDLDTLNDSCGILVFDGNKKARLVDMTNIDSELGFYFSK